MHYGLCTMDYALWTMHYGLYTNKTQYKTKNPLDYSRGFSIQKDLRLTS
jgi:hypothetical protein